MNALKPKEQNGKLSTEGTDEQVNEPENECKTKWHKGLSPLLTHPP